VVVAFSTTCAATTVCTSLAATARPRTAAAQQHRWRAEGASPPLLAAEHLELVQLVSRLDALTGDVQVQRSGKVND